MAEPPDPFDKRGEITPPFTTATAKQDQTNGRADQADGKGEGDNPGTLGKQGGPKMAPGDELYDAVMNSKKQGFSPIPKDKGNSPDKSKPKGNDDPSKPRGPDGPGL